MAFTIRQAIIRHRFSAAATGDGGGNFVVGPGQNFPDKSYTFQIGTGTGMVNREYVDSFTILAGSTNTIDLTACTYASTNQNFTKVKNIQFALSATTTADTDPTVLVGPQGIANGAILCFGGTTGKVDVRGWFENENVVNGWGVTSGNKIIQMTNQGTYPVTVYVQVLGNG